MHRNFVSFIFIILALFAYTGYCFMCLDGSMPDEYGVSCYCNGGRMYNAREGKCQGVCDYFGNNICGADKYNHGKCIQDDTDSSGYTCGCEEGYTDPDLDGRCLDLNECNEGLQTCLDENHEECSNYVGSASCKCEDGYFRNDSGICLEHNSCLNPLDNDCQLMCESTGPGTFNCLCPEGFVMDSQTNVCTVENEDDICDEDCGTNSECMMVDGKKTCYPYLGYEELNNGTIVDKHECESSEYECGIYSYCADKEGYYYCACEEYSHFNPSFNECQYSTCRAGEVFYAGRCEDPCDMESFSCPTGTECLTDLNSVSFCECQIDCLVKSSIESPTTERFYLYEGYFITPYGVNGYSMSNFYYNVTKSLESIFGTGKVHVSDVSGTRVDFDLSLSADLSDTSIIVDIILASCLHLTLNSEDPKCVLPAGTIINEENIRINVKEITPPCEENGDELCPTDLQECVDSSSNETISAFECRCVVGYETIISSRGDVSCLDIDECLEIQCSEQDTCVNQPGTYDCITELDQNMIDGFNNEIQNLENDVDYLQIQLDDAERNTVIVGVVLGVVLCIVVIVCIALMMQKNKLKKSLKEEHRNIVNS